MSLPRPSKFEAPCELWDLGALADCCPCAVDADQADIDAAVARAISDIYVSTCRRWPGCCRVEVRPCPPRCSCMCGRCDHCGEYVTADLWDAFCTDRVGQVVAVNVDGVAVPASAWRVDADSNTWRGRWLVLQSSTAWRADARLCWPDQDRQLPNGDPGTWSIVADIGGDPPADVLAAAADLACEYLKACKQPDACNLHDGIQSIVRRGVTINFADLAEGNTGLPSLDRVLLKYGCGPADNTRGVDPCPDWSWIPVARPVDCGP